MRAFGGMLSAEFHLSPQQMQKLISSFKLFTLAESLGGVESLVCHPDHYDSCHCACGRTEKNRIE